MPAKKKAATRKASPPARHESERRQMAKAGGGTFDGFLASMPASLRPLAKTLAGIVDDASPGLEKQLKWGWPAFVIPGRKGMSSVLCALMTVGDRYLNVGFFRGAELDDPQGRLEGEGKGMRHIKVHGPADVDASYFAALVRQARALE